jgi:hypothetical protein
MCGASGVRDPADAWDNARLFRRLFRFRQSHALPMANAQWITG